jgi:hypothetical protein
MAKKIKIALTKKLKNRSNWRNVCYHAKSLSRYCLQSDFKIQTTLYFYLLFCVGLTLGLLHTIDSSVWEYRGDKNI